ncbi:helix-turn-helix domain-containing protein [Parabacteroides sp.]
MEIVSIEKKSFEMMLASFNTLSEKIAALRHKSDGRRLERWLTGEEVCGQLRISTRTLQTLRDKRLIGYSQINRRFYYKPEEVKRLIPLMGTLYPGGK